MPTGWLPNVQPQQPIASSWGNTIRDRTVTTFDTIAQRDSQLPSPTAGMVCYVLADKTMYLHDGTVWKLLQNPRLIVEQVRNTGFTAIGTTEAVLPGMSAAITAVAGRNYYSQLMGRLLPASGATLATFRVRNGSLAGAELARMEFGFIAAVSLLANLEAPLAGITPGALTVVMTLQANVGTIAVTGGGGVSNAWRITETIAP